MSAFTLNASRHREWRETFRFFFSLFESEREGGSKRERKTDVKKLISIDRLKSSVSLERTTTNCSILRVFFLVAIAIVTEPIGRALKVIRWWWWWWWCWWKREQIARHDKCKMRLIWKRWQMCASAFRGKNSIETKIKCTNVLFVFRRCCSIYCVEIFVNFDV